MRKKMRVLGIDPGFERLGVAIVEKAPREKEVVIFSDCIKTSVSLPHPERLLVLGETIEKIIKKWKPDEVALEKLFLSTNQKTAMKVAGVCGLIQYLCAKNKLEEREFSPPQIKTAITGYGKADKKDVQNMVCRLVKLEAKKRHDDEYDAIAIALTAIATSHSLSTGE